MHRVFIVLSFVIASTTLFGQQFQMKQYKVANGLPSDIVKGVAQDSLGFFWIATDDGLVKFDGLRFTTYRDALHSQYAKGFLKTKEGKLLLFGDLDLIEIDNQIDTVVFKTIRQGARNPTDTMLYFPKSLYEDRNKNIWVGEPQSVVLLSGNKLKRFDFDLNERSPQFLRSFSFFEDAKGDFFTTSYFGNVYKLNRADSTLTKQLFTFPTDVNTVKTIGSTLWIACADGIYTSELLKAGGCATPKRIFQLNSPYDFEFLDSGHLIIATSLKNHFIGDLENRSIKDVGYVINNANGVYVSKEKDIWLSSSDGAVLLQENSFLSVGHIEGFVESIAEDEQSHSIYFCTMEELYRVDETIQGVSSPQLVSRIPRGYFQALAWNNEGLWATNAFSLFQYKKNTILRKWNFEQEGRFIQDISLDSKNNLWLSQAGNAFAMCLTPEMNLIRYKIPLSKEGIINCVREGKNGMYVTSNGEKSYLFFKSHDDSIFKNISLPIHFRVAGDLNINDLVEVDSILWIASSEGLLRYDFKKIEKVNLGERYTDITVKTVKYLQEGQILFVNAMGLFRFEINSGNYWLYDEGSGIASNAITMRGLLVDDDKRVWIGTSRGISYSRQPILEGEATQVPFFVDVKANGVRRKFTKGLSIPYGSFLNIDVSAITFPENNVTLQYRLANVDSTWKLLENSPLSLSELREGEYEVQVRARKHGGYSWSKNRSLLVIVQNPFWLEWWFIVFVSIAMFVIVYMAVIITAHFSRKRRKYLEELVAQRTSELQNLNEELLIRNAELDRFVYSASHDLSAPLKSMLGLVNVARKENPADQVVTYLDMIEKSAKRLEAFIKDVISYSRNARATVEKAEIDFESFVNTLLGDHQYATNYGNIDFRISSQLKSKLLTDEMRLKIILNNLISNAIKFHFTSDGRKPFIQIRAFENENQYTIEVEDNGRGIEKGMQDKIFQMFFRATDSVQGSGLGLYILKETITRLGGDVSVQSSVDIGTTFTIHLPKG